MLTGVRKRLLPLTKREGSDSVIISDFKSKISITNENNLSCKDFSYFGRSALLCRQGRELSALVPQYLSNFSDKVFSRFTSHFSHKRIAFTLAEVLITLGIIGVIAALTLPSIITQYQKKVTVQSLKVAYSLLYQAVQESVSENGEIPEWNYSLNSATFDDTYLLPYLKVIKKCNGGKCITTDGFHGYYELNGHKYTQIDKSYILSNGMILMKDSYGLNMGFITYMVDINGNKKPNKMGRDIFTFYLFNHSSIANNDYKEQNKKFTSNLYPGGLDNIGIPHYSETRNYLLSPNAHRACNKNATIGYHSGVGAACAAVIMKDNWEIKSDYPWQ